MKSKFFKKAVAVFLSMMLVVQLIVPMSFTASAAVTYVYEGGAGAGKIVDLDTSTKYALSLGDNASTEFAGRIWTDKSVYASDITFETFGGGSATFKLNENKNGEDFLVAYSALATSESVTGSTQAPVDVVFIVDVSGSMSNSDSAMDNQLSRIANTVNAVNASIDKLMAMNEYTRIAVVVFSDTASVLLPLDHYTKVRQNESELPWLSLNKITAGGTVELTARAVGEAEGNINEEVNVTGGTNIQMGLYTGMNVLASRTDVVANVNGQNVPRTPSVILLSDGAPTYSSGPQGNTPSNWWAPLNNKNNGPGGSPYYGNGFKALLTGAYMKRAIDQSYGLTDSGNSTKVYTIGMGITDLPNNNNYWSYVGEKDLAYITLNPKGNWNSNNNMAESIRDAWTSYTNQTPGGNGSITVRVNSTSYYAVRHPDNDIYTSTNKTALQDLVDGYYDADNASAVNTVFDAIVANISIATPQVPTEIKGTNPMTDGYITYTDPIGDYMEIKDIKGIVYAGATHTAKTVTTTVNGNTTTTTYVFTDVVESAIYGNQNLRNIVITVDETDGKQVLTVKIPASVIPIRLNTVELNPDGTVKSHTNNGAFPARVVYSVGLQSEILKETDSGVVYVDKTKLSNEYVAANTNSDGTINFYANAYSGNKVDGIYAGDAVVRFEPSHSNPFYYILEDMPIYKDAQFRNQVTKDEGIDEDTIYYYRDEFYHGTSIGIDPVQRTGAQLMMTDIVEGQDGYLYRAAGSPRPNRILKFEGTKERNATKTAEDFYLPTFDSSTEDDWLVVYLGNNGVFNLSAGGNLEISKTVLAAAGLTAPDKDFEFTVALNGTTDFEGEYDYIVVDEEGATVGSGVLSGEDSTITLADGQTATIFSLPDGTTYEVTEAAVEGFTSSAEGAAGAIVANETRAAVFTNTYNVETLTWPTEGGFSGTKVLERPGNVWTEDDVFTFFMSPYNNAPLPEGYNAAEGVVVDSPDANSSNIATFSFGNIKFTAPGTYRYTIYEKEPENHEYLPGLSYSRALYRVVIEVVDNGDGTMSVDTYKVNKLYTDEGVAQFTYDNAGNIVMNDNVQNPDDADIVFVNSYDAESVTRVPVALKDYTDNSGQKPLESGMFEFELKALGYLDENDDLVQDITNVPMPEGSENGVIITYNEGHNITFPGVTFDDSNIPEGKTSITFRYQMREIAGNINGMDYDESVYEIDVIVSVDPESQVVNVDAVYPNDIRIVTFYNTYTPTPAVDSISGSKIFNGRDMVSGEEFNIVLGANAATANAIREGYVEVPADIALSGLKDGVKKNFAFEDIKFNRAGTYVFTVSETAGSLAAVEYDDTVYTFTIVVDDTNNDGVLEIVSNTNDSRKADFVNTYTSRFTDTPFTLTGSKTLIGKTLLEGEFYFQVKEYFDDDFVREYLVSHAADLVADEDGAYVGAITFVNAASYTTAGEYEYIITEQIPDDDMKVGGTQYDETAYRCVVTVKDDNQGNLYVADAELYSAENVNSSWRAATEVMFENIYTPRDAENRMPVITKVLTGDRKDGLKDGEFSFQLFVEYASDANGIHLPAADVVANNASGAVVFDKITFTKPGTYIVGVKEVVPEEQDRAPGVEYSDQIVYATFTVVDDRQGTLSAVLTNFNSGDTIVNNYINSPAEFQIEIEKEFTGREGNVWASNDQFKFQIVADEETVAAIEAGALEMALAEGSTDSAFLTIDTQGEKAGIVVKAIRSGVYSFTITEVNTSIPGVTYDTAAYKLVVVIEDNNNGQLEETSRVLTKNSEEAEEILFVNTYKATTPKPVPDTGVGEDLWMWMALCVLSGITAIGAVFFRKKETAEN